MSEPLLALTISISRDELTGLTTYPEFVALMRAKIEQASAALADALHRAMSIRFVLPEPEAEAQVPADGETLVIPPLCTRTANPRAGGAS